jgi:hypothetical protein
MAEQAEVKIAVNDAASKTLEVIAKNIDTLTARLQKTKQEGDATENAFKRVGEQIKNMGPAVQASLAAAGITVWLGLVQQAFGFVKSALSALAEGEALNRLEVGLRRVAIQAGLTGEQLMASLEKATKYKVDETTLARYASRLADVGIEADKMGSVLQFAFQKAAETGVEAEAIIQKITQSAATGNARGIARMGLVIDKAAALRAEAERLGVPVEALTKEQEKQAVQAQLLEQVHARATIATAGLGTAYKQAAVAAQDAADEMKKTLAGALPDELQGSVFARMFGSPENLASQIEAYSEAARQAEARITQVRARIAQRQEASGYRSTPDIREELEEVRALEAQATLAWDVIQANIGQTTLDTQDFIDAIAQIGPAAIKNGKDATGTLDAIRQRAEDAQAALDASARAREAGGKGLDAAQEQALRTQIEALAELENRWVASTGSVQDYQRYMNDAALSTQLAAQSTGAVREAHLAAADSARKMADAAKAANGEWFALAGKLDGIVNQGRVEELADQFRSWGIDIQGLSRGELLDLAESLDAAEAAGKRMNEAIGKGDKEAATKALADLRVATDDATKGFEQLAPGTDAAAAAAMAFADDIDFATLRVNRLTEATQNLINVAYLVGSGKSADLLEFPGSKDIAPPPVVVPDLPGVEAKGGGGRGGRADISEAEYLARLRLAEATEAMVRVEAEYELSLVRIGEASIGALEREAQYREAQIRYQRDVEALVSANSELALKRAQADREAIAAQTAALAKARSEVLALRDAYREAVAAVDVGVLDAQTDAWVRLASGIDRVGESAERSIEVLSSAWRAGGMESGIDAEWMGRYEAQMKNVTQVAVQAGKAAAAAVQGIGQGVKDGVIGGVAALGPLMGSLASSAKEAAYITGTFTLLAAAIAAGFGQYQQALELGAAGTAMLLFASMAKPAKKAAAQPIIQSEAAAPQQQSGGINLVINYNGQPFETREDIQDAVLSSIAAAQYRRGGAIPAGLIGG